MDFFFLFPFGVAGYAFWYWYVAQRRVAMPERMQKAFDEFYQRGRDRVRYGGQPVYMVTSDFNEFLARHGLFPELEATTGMVAGALVKKGHHVRGTGIYVDFQRAWPRKEQ